MSSGAKALFIVCGEPSGEAYAAGVARAFRKRHPGVRMEGIGGPRLAAEGVDLLLEYDRISVVGITEVARHIPAILSGLRIAVRRATHPETGAVLLVDFPDFNFRVGKKARAANVPVVYYIPPQLWAWRRSRAADLAGFANGVVAAFPFEEPLLREQGVNVKFAGHPILDELAPVLDAKPDPRRFGIPEGKRVVGLLPGSREGEIRAHWPPLADAAAEIRKRFPDVHFAVPLASPRFRRGIEAALGEKGLSATIVERDRHLLFRGLAAAIAVSGTATLELALLGVPHVIVYRTSALTYRIGKRLARVSWIGLPNIVAGEGFLPELIQAECRADRIAAEIGALLSDPERRRALSDRCVSLRGKLKGPGPAPAVVEMLEKAAGAAWA